MALPVPPLRLQTPGFAGYALSYSPFIPGRLACASSSNFGLVGNGRLHVIDSNVTSGRAAVGKFFDSQDGMFDLAWSEMHENQIVTGCGDGSVKLWDVMLKDFPIQSWTEHNREVFGIDWNNVKKDIFSSSSWDTTVKIWTPTSPASLLTLRAHEGCVYNAPFSPHNPDLLASCSADGYLKIWDLRSPPTTAPNLSKHSLVIPAHQNEVLTCDWNKYNSNLIATGSVDRVLKVIDLRMGKETAALMGHEYAIRRLAWSPHRSNVIASASYDMTVRVWEVDPKLIEGPPQLDAIGQWGRGGIGGNLRSVHDLHTEFVVGLAWDLWEEGFIASAAWDQQVHMWKAF